MKYKKKIIIILEKNEFSYKYSEFYDILHKTNFTIFTSPKM